MSKKTNGGAGGRPPKITKDVLAKLEEGARMSFTNDEMALHADINPATLYRYYKKHPEFSERVGRLRNMPNMKAKEVILKGISKGNKEDAKRWLERKARVEFAKRVETENKDVDEFEGVNLIPAVKK